MRIYIIGMPGVGKSYVSVLLGKSLDYKVVDLDEYIEEKEKMSISDIFKQYGENEFRIMERSALEEIKKLDNIIISTGGGIIKNPDNKKLMDGVKILLSAPLQLIKERLNESIIDRPLLKIKTVEELYNERIALYRDFMDFEIDNTVIDDTLSHILIKLEEYK